MRIGIDLGGTKIEIAALDGTAEIRLRRRVPTPAGDYAGTPGAIAALVEAPRANSDVPRASASASPAPSRPFTGLIRNANSTVLIGKPLDRDLMERLGRPVRLDNDANCFILSEAHGGAAAGAKLAFGVILGTGVGGGIAFEGRPYDGRNAIAGEWGHTPLPWPQDDERTEPCYCGRNGCIETFLCGPKLTQQYRERTGRALNPTEIASAANDRRCRRGSSARTLRRSPRARSCGNHRHPRPGRLRIRRRRIQPRSLVRQRAAAACALRLRRQRRHADSPRNLRRFERSSRRSNAVALAHEKLLHVARDAPTASTARSETQRRRRSWRPCAPRLAARGFRSGRRAFGRRRLCREDG